MVRLCIWGLINAINQSALNLSQQRALLLPMEKHDGHHVHHRVFAQIPSGRFD